MPDPIDFYFDFSSPYGYLAAQRIDALAERHGRMVAWRPILLGAVFKITGGAPLAHLPMKGAYARRDLARTARRLGVKLTLPRPFPFSGVAPSRAFYWLADRDPAQARGFAGAVFDAAFGAGLDVSGARAVLELAGEVGADRDALEAALQDPAVKERLRAEVEAAIGRGVFGSPFVIIDGEPFWGVDHLDQAEAWLESGGW